MRVFDVKSLFEVKSRLRELSDDLKKATEHQSHSLKALNEEQSVVLFHEVNWQSHQCVYSIKDIQIQTGSKKMIQDMVKSILIEYYGPAAAQLRLLLK